MNMIHNYATVADINENQKITFFTTSTELGLISVPKFSESCILCLGMGWWRKNSKIPIKRIIRAKSNIFFYILVHFFSSIKITTHLTLKAVS